MACNTAGGTHHAFPGHGSGFCILNDLAYTAQMLLTRRSDVKRILILDLDVHQVLFIPLRALPDTTVLQPTHEFASVGCKFISFDATQCNRQHWNGCRNAFSLHSLLCGCHICCIQRKCLVAQSGRFTNTGKLYSNKYYFIIYLDVLRGLQVFHIQGDGTAVCLQDVPATTTISFHAASNFPTRKQRSTVDVPLPDGMGDEDYLRQDTSSLLCSRRTQDPTSV